MLITSCLLRSHTSHSKPIQQSCAGARPQLETVAEERRKYWRSQKTLQAGMGNWVGPSRPWRSGVAPSEKILDKILHFSTF